MIPTGKPTIDGRGILPKTRPFAEHEVLAAEHFLVAHEVQIS